MCVVSTQGNAPGNEEEVQTHKIRLRNKSTVQKVAKGLVKRRGHVGPVVARVAS